jgi:hypothetical protein
VTTEVTVVWIEPGSAADQRALDEWALARGVRLREPSEEEAPKIAVDLGVGERVESELEKAREGAAALDAEATERALARAEALLRAHPELPQAAWLMAEVERGWAARWARIEPVDRERAGRAWKRAAALDGGRAPGVGEVDYGALAPGVTARLDVQARGEVAALVDGSRADRVLERAPGEHQLVIRDGASTVFAAWVTVADGATLRIVVPGAPACSSVDLAGARLEDDRIAASATCGSWIAVVPASRGAVRVATCTSGACGPLLLWSTQAPAKTPLEPRVQEGSRWPVWATISLGAVGALALTGVAVVAAGAFRAREDQTRFVNGGVKIQ